MYSTPSSDSLPSIPFRGGGVKRRLMRPAKRQRKQGTQLNTRACLRIAERWKKKKNRSVNVTSVAKQFRKPVIGSMRARQKRYYDSTRASHVRDASSPAGLSSAFMHNEVSHKGPLRHTNATHVSDGISARVFGTKIFARFSLCIHAETRRPDGISFEECLMGDKRTWLKW